MSSSSRPVRPGSSYAVSKGLGRLALSLLFLLHQSLFCLFCFESFSEGLANKIQLSLGGRGIPEHAQCEAHARVRNPGFVEFVADRGLGFQPGNLSLPGPRGCQVLSAAHCPDSGAANETLSSVSMQGCCWNLVIPEGAPGKSRENRLQGVRRNRSHQSTNG